MTARRDFTYEEWNCLLHLYRHESADVPSDLARRLRELGMTEQVERETGLSAAGRHLIEHELLIERRIRLQR